jgi:hypothetical protein
MRLRRRGREVGLTTRERALLLAGLFRLRVAYAENAAQGEAIGALVFKLGGDPEAVLFGVFDDGLGQDVPSSIPPTRANERRSISGITRHVDARGKV